MGSPGLGFDGCQGKIRYCRDEMSNFLFTLHLVFSNGEVANYNPPQLRPGTEFNCLGDEF